MVVFGFLLALFFWVLSFVHLHTYVTQVLTCVKCFSDPNALRKIGLIVQA